MTQLDELLREHRDQTPVDDLVEHEALQRVRHTLRAVATGPKAHASGPRRRSRRYAGRFALVAGLAAAIAVVVALLPGGAGKDTGQLTPATASAQVFLQKAARAVLRQGWQPLGSGRYFYFREIGSNPGHNGPAPARPTEIQDVWVGANGFARIVQTGADTVLAGGDVLMFHATPQQLRTERQRQLHGRHLRILAYPQKYRWVDLDYQQLIHLPSDPAQLQRLIERHASGGGPRFSQLFGYVEGLLMWAPPVRPTVSAAIYHVLARLPGMRLIGTTRDPLGRPGTAVGLFFRNQPGRIELIFNPRTGALLGERGVSLDPDTMHAPVGTALFWSAIERSGVVSSDYHPAGG